MRSRYRPTVTTASPQCPVVPCTFDFVDFDWVSDNVDAIHTVHAGLNATLIPSRLDLSVAGNYSVSRGEINTRNPLTPTSGIASQNATATAKPVPDFSDSLLKLETNLKYHFSKVLTAGVFYAFERFTKHDWRTDTPTPAPTGESSVWLGNDLKNYTAHILGLKVGYKFE